jgi:DNA-directed RNA polymerase subunit F
MNSPPANPFSLRCRHLAGVVLLLAFAACSNLAAVREFAKTSAATADFAQIVTDYQLSPQRQLVYQLDEATEHLRTIAETRKERAKRLLDCQKVVVDYMSALGDLAADELTSVDSEIDGLTKALEDAKVIGEADSRISKETASAAAAIAKVLARAALDGWRQGQVCKIVREVDPHLQVALTGMLEVLDKDLRGSLQNERVAIEKRFGAWAASAKANGDPDGAPPISRVLMAERVLAITRMQEQLDRYLDVLRKIASGHRGLVEHREALTTDKAIAVIRAHSKDLQTLYKQIRILAN